VLTARLNNRSGANKLKRTVKKKTQARREWTATDLRDLKKHSRARTPVAKVSKDLKRTVAALRVKASQLGVGLGHQR
jgi:hypothetical protein